jgi:hypothetical protein
MSFDVAVVGNIAAGKTTLCNRFVDLSGYRYVAEPYAENKYLEPFYKNPHRYAYKVQRTFLDARRKNYEDSHSRGLGNIFDNHLLQDVVFARAVYDMGWMTDVQYQYYLAAYEKAVEGVRVPDVFVFLDVSPSVSFERCKRRRASDP